MSFLYPLVLPSDLNHLLKLDASLFLRNHPYPGRPLAETLDTSPHRQKRINLLAPFKCLCGRAEAEEEDDSGWGWGGEDGGEFSNHDEARDRFQWTEETMVSFREELEKLVLLDVLMRNTFVFSVSITC